MNTDPPNISRSSKKLNKGKPLDTPNQSPSRVISLPPTSQPSSLPSKVTPLPPSLQPSSRPTMKESNINTDPPNLSPSNKKRNKGKPLDTPNQLPSKKTSLYPSLQPSSQPTMKDDKMNTDPPNILPSSKKRNKGKPLDTPNQLPSKVTSLPSSSQTFISSQSPLLSLNLQPSFENKITYLFVMKDKNGIIQEKEIITDQLCLITQYIHLTIEAQKIIYDDLYKNNNISCSELKQNRNIRR
jgi:hypothetical protein